MVSIDCVGTWMACINWAFTSSFLWPEPVFDIFLLGPPQELDFGIGHLLDPKLKLWEFILKGRVKELIFW
jgi:hypothetical protein